ncbi:SprT [Geosmithia morbida]|uniref:SprT n=1 Tax=Geosmithia morbida TaxID=1094350 RepID=A0A9P5D0H4_9HYPO|nr:SprT [Geosmithia morbida]KAF4121607.1 SprT [Geosmithia morbida]
MARVVDFCPGSDDELPEISTILRKPGDKSTKATLNLVSPKKEMLVPKSASKSVSRRVRRLETNSNITGNLLFQRCDPEDAREINRGDNSIFQGSPRKTPMRAREPKHPDSVFSNESIFDDSPPQTVRTGRARRVKTTTTIFEDDEDDEPLRPRSRHSRQVGKDKLPPLRLQPTTPILRRNRAGSRPGSRYSRHDANSFVPDQSTIFSTTSDDSQYQDKSSVSNGSSSNASSHYRSAEDSVYNDSSYSAFSSTGSSRSGNDSSLSLSSWEMSFGQREIKPTSASILKPRNSSSINMTLASTTQAQPPKLSIPPSLERLPEESPGMYNENFGLIEPTAAEELTNQLSKLRLQFKETDDSQDEPAKKESPTTPPRTPTKTTKSTGLVSPLKAAQIPKTPHGPSADAFWSQDVVDGWNEKHSPRKPILAPKLKSLSKSPQKDVTRKTFDSTKHDVAAKFIQELDSRVTEGKISELAESTGGVTLVWSKTLNTTAGRANWRRETVRTSKPDGTEVVVQHKHHASIELAEKVIDNEDRLLNVLAHEFCHLANFMVSGITGNPHGKEFKVWATKCSRSFSDRGVKVTTKHTYEIDFKYIWECGECSTVYKRHSKSIKPEKHRCGTCKGTLKQIKPVPRGGGKPSQYQTFVKEQMKIVKQENPGRPQKDIMKIIGAKWANRTSEPVEDPSTIQDQVDEQLAAGLIDLTLDNSA